MEVDFALDEYQALRTAARDCGLPVAEYARLAVLNAVLGSGAVNHRETQRALANAARTRL